MIVSFFVLWNVVIMLDIDMLVLCGSVMNVNVFGCSLGCIVCSRIVRLFLGWFIGRLCLEVGVV